MPYSPQRKRELYELMPPERQKRVYELAVELKNSPRRLEEQGWRKWYATIFGQEFIDALDSAETDDKHHSEALEWHWTSRVALLKGERPPDDYYAYFPTWSRGNMKTTLGRAMLICDACLSVTAGVGGYALIPSGTKKKGRSTAISLEHLLHTSKVQQYYPLLSKVKRNPYGQSKGWTADFIYTEANYVFHFVGLDEGMAGANVIDVRPTLIMPDDIDSREDSPVISENRFHVFTSEVLPSRQANTLVYWAQNLISRYSVRYRIEKQRDRVLTNRKPTLPVPAVRGLATEPRTVKGIVKDVVVGGRPTWKIWTLQRVQDEIDTYGLDAFRRECQHEVEQDSEGLVLKNYNDSVHIISHSEFASIFGTPDLPQKWGKDVGNDWARTKTTRHANVAGILTVSAQNSPLPGHLFFFHPMSFPTATEPEEVAKRLLTVISPTVKVGERKFTWDELVKATLQKSHLDHLISNQTELIKARRSVLAQVVPALVRTILQAQNYRLFRGSHEQSKTGALSIYKSVFGLPFVGVNPGGDGGIDTLNMLMRVDYTLPHAIRPGMMGYTNFNVVVADDRSKPAQLINDTLVYPPIPCNTALTPDDLHDADLLRYQFMNCRYRDPYLTVQGEKEGDVLKIDDDFLNLFMMLLYDHIPQPAPLAEHEMRDLQLTPELQASALVHIPDVKTLEGKLQSRRIHLGAMIAEEKRKEAAAQRMSVPKLRFKK